MRYQLQLLFQASRLGLSLTGPDPDSTAYANGHAGQREVLWRSPELEIVLRHLPGGRLALDLNVLDPAQPGVQAAAAA